MLCAAGGIQLSAQAPSTSSYQDRFVTLNGLRIHYLDWGSPDKPVFWTELIERLLHGLCHG